MSGRAPRRLAQAAGLLGVALVLGACGLGPQEAAERINPLDVPNGLLSETPPVAVLADGPVTFSVYLTGPGANSVLSFARKTRQPPQAQDVLDTLLQGPSNEELANGFRSAIPFGTSARVRLSGLTANIDLSREFLNATRNDQDLALSQLLCTVTALRGIERARFTVIGLSLNVRRRDGSATAEPLSGAELQIPCQT